MKNNEIITVIAEKYTYKLKTVECPKCHKYDQALFEEDEIGVTHECVHCYNSFNAYLEDLENE